MYQPKNLNRPKHKYFGRNGIGPESRLYMIFADGSCSYQAIGADGRIYSVHLGWLTEEGKIERDFLYENGKDRRPTNFSGNRRKNWRH